MIWYDLLKEICDTIDKQNMKDHVIIRITTEAGNISCPAENVNWDPKSKHWILDGYI